MSLVYFFYFVFFFFKQKTAYEMRISDWSSVVCSSDLPVRKKRWVVYAKPPFAGPEAVLAYLSRYTHRVAISNSRLLRFDDAGVTFRYKDYRKAGAGRQQVMTLAADEFIRRFLLHALPRGFHRIRHYGLLASARRKDHLEPARRLLDVAPAPAGGRT